MVASPPVQVKARSLSIKKALKVFETFRAFLLVVAGLAGRGAFADSVDRPGSPFADKHQFQCITIRVDFPSKKTFLFVQFIDLFVTRHTHSEQVFPGHSRVPFGQA
jgi:hypothetical protein